ncbi:MAG: carboxypeptidase M32, partial [Alphaproteobacteria bacterium]
MTEANEAYKALEARFARAIRIDEAAGWLHWDQSVMMPPGGAEARGEQSAALAEAAHEIVAAAATGDLLAAASAGEDPWREANLREMRRRHAAATAVPPDLVGALARARAAAENAWRDARPASDFALALPSFRNLVGLVRQEAAALGEALALGPYDALLEQYDPGRRAADI